VVREITVVTAAKAAAPQVVAMAGGVVRETVIMVVVDLAAGAVEEMLKAAVREVVIVKGAEAMGIVAVGAKAAVVAAAVAE